MEEALRGGACQPPGDGEPRTRCDAGGQTLQRAPVAVPDHRPGISGRVVARVSDETGGGAPARGLLVLVYPASVPGHRLAVEKLRVTGGIAGVVDQHDHRLALDAHTLVVVPLPFG